jgi:hypothetical protein
LSGINSSVGGDNSISESLAVPTGDGSVMEQLFAYLKTFSSPYLIAK